jgi:type II secretory pathway pseudopilin PulG
MAPAMTRIRPTGDFGFTIIEVCVAMALLMLAAAGVARMSAIATRAIDTARVETSATALASQKIEQLRGLRWTRAPDGSPVSDRTTDLSVEPATGGGPGLSASPQDALDTSTHHYVDYLDARGGWVGTGTSPPPAARYIRRWSVAALPEDPDNLLVIRVLVTSREQDRRAIGPRRRLAGEALVTALLARRAP